MKNEFCPFCGEDRDCEMSRRARTIRVRGTEISVELRELTCNVCKETFDDPMARDPLEVAYDAYRDQEGLLCPFEIKAFREKLKLSQKGFADLLGMSPATISRYETGALQEPSHDTAIRACMNPEFLQNQYERRKHRLDEAQRDRLEDSFVSQLRVSTSVDGTSSKVVEPSISNYEVALNGG